MQVSHVVFKKKSLPQTIFTDVREQWLQRDITHLHEGRNENEVSKIMAKKEHGAKGLPWVTNV